MIGKAMLSLTLSILSALPAFAGSKNPERMFSIFDGQKEYYEYTCIPTGETGLKGGRNTGDLPVDKIKLIEMVTTHDKGCGDEMRDAIARTVALNDMELFSTQNTESKRNDFYVGWDDSRGVFTHLLILKYKDHSHCDAQLMYLVGDFTAGDLEKLF